MPSVFHLAPLTAEEATKKVQEILRALVPNVDVNIGVQTSLDTFSATTKGKGREIADDLNDMAAMATKAPFVGCRHFTISRGQGQIRYTEGDGVVADLTITKGDQFPAGELDLVKGLHGILTLHSKRALLTETVPEAHRQILRAQEAATDTLIARTRSLDHFMEEIAKRNQAHYEDLQKKLEADFTTREQELRTSIDDEQATLAKERRAFEEAAAEFDKRESKYVRRDLLDRMKANIEKRTSVTLSPSTQNKRTIVHVVCVVAMVASGLLLGYTTATLPADLTVSDWRLGLQIALASLGLASTVIYYIRWNDNWFKRHADAEFKNMAFENDILRASWLAELLFEWETEKDNAFPTELLEGFSHRLFTEAGSPAIEHPAEALTRLLKDAKTIKVGKGALEVSKE